MNPDDKFKGNKSFYERKAERIAANGVPSDRQKPKNPAPKPQKPPATKSIQSHQIMIDWNSTMTRFAQSISQMNISFTASASGIASDSKFSGKEFAAGTVKGARAFRIDTLGRLIGPVYHQVWLPGENLAECKAAEPHKEGKYPECRCGFYGYYEGSNDYHDEGMASGVVEGYGDTVIGTNGFRVTKARIIALTLNDDVPMPVRRLVQHNYADIPMFETFARMVSEFPPDYELDEKIAPSPETDPDFWNRPA